MGVHKHAASRVSAAKNWRDLAWVVKIAQKIVGTVLPNLNTVHASRLHKQASNIVTGPTRPGHSVFVPLQSQEIQSPQSPSRLRNTFFPRAVASVTPTLP